MFHLYLDYTITPVETESDILGRAYVHYKAWHETYARMIDRRYLNEVHTLQRCEAIARRSNDGVLIAKVGARVVGLVGYGAYHDGTLPGAGEIYGLYLLQDCQGYGIGGAMLRAALEHLSEYDKVALWVLEKNENAIRFYNHFGFLPDGERKEIMLGTPQTELRMIKCR